MWQYQSTDELYHHGILGQKWGIRRYQNPDGTLTPAGRRRAQKLANNYAKLTGKKLIVKKKTVKEERQKSVKEMSDAELINKINRIRLEESYLKATQPRERQKVSKGKRAVNYILNKVVLPGATRAGTAYVEQEFKKLLGVNNNDNNNNNKNNRNNNVDKNVNTQKAKQTVEKTLNDITYTNKNGSVKVDKKAIKKMSNEQYKDLTDYIIQDYATKRNKK